MQHWKRIKGFFKFFLVYAVCTLLFLGKGNTFEALVTHGERQWKQATVNHPFVTVLCKKSFLITCGEAVRS